MSHLDYLLESLAPLLLAIDTHEGDTLSSLDSDDDVVFSTSGSWSPIRHVTWGDLRKIELAAKGLKYGPDGLLYKAYGDVQK